MAEGERRQRVITSTPRVSPEEVANRAFASSFRGYSESEVRSFLGRVAEELTASREREGQLLGTLDDLEERLRSPKPLDEQELLEALGEETARLLRTAREASEDIRRKAEERSSSVMEEAQTEAHRLRTDAAEILGVRSQEAEAVAADIVADAEARAAEIRLANERTSEEQRQRAEEEAAAIVETARQQGRDMLEEARTARERVLADLGRRRSLLQAQVEELRQGRDRLLEAYRVVKRTFLDATEALSQVEARAASERAQVTGSREGGIEETSEPTGTDTGADTGTGTEAAAVDDLETAEAAAPSSDLPHVDVLFARLRAGQQDPVAEDTLLPDAGAAGDGVAEDLETGAAEVIVDVDVEVVEVVEVVDVEVEAIVADEPAGPEPAVEWRARHTAAVEPLVRPLVRQAKRAAQDEQNGLLDAVRRYKGRPTAAQVLPDAEATISTWTGILRDALGGAYGAGLEAVGQAAAPAPDALLREAAQSVAQPLRDRVAAAIDDADTSETHGLVERIGARYREWKNQQLEHTLGDVMVVAWTRGVYDGSEDGTVLKWLPLTEGRCADCDDNALEPTVKGAAFPTGQTFPPAHPGCRCLLAPESALEVSGTS